MKRKVEQYLLDSDIPYTVINPTGMVVRETGKKKSFSEKPTTYSTRIIQYEVP